MLLLLVACAAANNPYPPFQQLFLPETGGVLRGFSPGLSLTTVRKQERGRLHTEDLRGLSYQLPMPAGWQAACIYLGDNDSVKSVIITAVAPNLLALDSLARETETWLSRRYGTARQTTAAVPAQLPVRVWPLAGAELRLIQQTSPPELICNLVIQPNL